MNKKNRKKIISVSGRGDLQNSFSSRKLFFAVFVSILLIAGFYGTTKRTFVTESFLRDGFSAPLSDFCSFLTGKTGKIFLVPKLPAGPAVFGIRVFTALFLLLLFAQIFLSALTLNVWLLFPLLLFYTAGVLSGFMAPAVSDLLPAAGIVFIMAEKVRRQSRNDEKQRGFFEILIPVTAAFIVTALLAGNLENSSGVRAILKDDIHAAFYDSGTSSLPEGNIAEAGPWRPASETALKVSLEEPQKLYLRGFTGETFEGGRWSLLSEELIKEQSDLFYWLHKEGFYGQTALGNLMRQAGTGEEKSFTVTNVSACRKWNYLPYSLSNTGSPLSTLTAGDYGFSESDGYTGNYVSGGLHEYYSAEKILSEDIGRGGKIYEHILSLEGSYRDHVYDTYLALPDKTIRLLGQLLGEPSEMSLWQIRQKVFSVLGEMDYNPDISGKDEKGEFVSWFLERKKAGYSIHFATACTILLRYYGVPARYVEGYYLSANEAAGLEPGTEIFLDESHAHAWAEYYLDGVGWIPMETTPGYIDGEEDTIELAAMGEGSRQNPDKNYQNNTVLENLRSDLPLTDETEELSNSSGFDLAEISENTGIMSVLLMILLLVLILLLLWTEISRIRLRRKLAKIGKMPPKEAVPLFFGYAAYLRNLAGIPPEESGTAYDNNLEALFSEHEITEEQKTYLKKYVADTKKECSRSMKFMRKLYYRTLRCRMI